ncbi:hypothetical protein AWR36_012440 [Microbulbifer flavimaris]|uniref:DUF2911 domain-containing protein n=1 Tax=Microbulbifer flavimaris TaxID=1781068 RepID=A0ABX4HXT4_9GAMM|nr:MULTISPECIES: hypothetical protein [Microbulbifer]PCO04798.1 hypothetical protein AWR36_012440 [Microbulbifer flavimaris]
MNILKSAVIVSAMLCSAAIAAADKKAVEIVPFEGKREYSQWIYDASAKGVFTRAGEIDDKSLVIRSDKAGMDQHGLVVKRIDATPFLGKRVRLKVDFKPTDVKQSVIVFFNAQKQLDDERKTLTWDSTWVEPIRGTSDWQSKEMVLQVPEEASFLGMGAGLAGPGQVEIGAVDVHEVPMTVAVTDKEYLSRLYDNGEYEKFLAEIENADMGDPNSLRYARIMLLRYNAMRELGKESAASKQLQKIRRTIGDREWQQANKSIWAAYFESEVMYLSGKLSEDDYIATVAALEFPTEKAEKSAMKGVYQTIGFNHRLNGDITGAKKAYAKAASREWGEDRDYTTVDRRLEEMKKAQVAMEN